MMQPATIPQEKSTETGKNMGSSPVALMSY